MWVKISLCGVLLASSGAWGDLLVAVNKHPDKEGAMFSRVGRLVSGRLDWGVPSRVAKAAALDVAYDGGQVAVLTYTDEKENTEVYCRVGASTRNRSRLRGETRNWPPSKGVRLPRFHRQFSVWVLHP